MDGGIIIDKPSGCTSHDVVAKVRRAISIRRVGHAGTLDPFATGVLIVCLGRATRLVQFLVGLNKEYEATIKLGFATDTQDLTGKQTTPLRSSNAVSLGDIELALSEFRGEQLQTPPMYSAKKVDGERLYRAARAGREVKREPVTVSVHAISLLSEPVRSGDGTCDVTIAVRCSSGTYIRTLAHDIGERLEVGAHLTALRRMSVGTFGINRAITLGALAQLASDGEVGRALVSGSDLVGHLPGLTVAPEEASLLANGRAIEFKDRAETLGAVGSFVRLCRESGQLIAVGEVSSPHSTVRPRVVMGQ